MPELPEVETVRRDLQQAIRGKKFDHTVVRKAKLVRGSLRVWQRELKGQIVSDVSRRGKLLIVALEPSGKYLLLHMKMTGQLIYRQDHEIVAGGHGWPPVEELPNKFTHIEFHFTDGGVLYFNDLRQFGYTQIVDEKGKEKVEQQFGIEPLSSAFTVEALTSILKSRQAPLKNVLLDQSLIAGLGNIYVDESSYRAMVRPMRRANSLTKKEINQLHKAIQEVLKQAIKYRGTTFNNYRDAKGRRGNFVKMLKVYGREGEPCECNKEHVIKKTKINGRGTAYCPICQK